jgi:hypothetical protein
MKNPKYYLNKVKEFFKGIKWKFQRARRGYSDCDLYSVKHWFWRVFPNMIRDFSKGLHSYPFLDGLDFQEWQAVLERMAIACERSDPDYWIEKLGDSYSAEELKLSFKQAEANLNAFMDMFGEYFYDLWD